jgi:hypothetical protein
MSTTYLDIADKDSATQEALRVMRAAYPGYRGRKFSVRVQALSNMDLRSYWDGGSRTDYTLIDLDSRRTVALPTQSPFDAPVRSVEQFVIRHLGVFDDGTYECDLWHSTIEAAKLPLNVGVVEHVIFQGRDQGLTLVIDPAKAAGLLPSPDTVTDDQQIVLHYTGSLKNTYGGETNLRFKEAHRETGIPETVWETAKASLIQSKHLRSNGSITPKGRNARRPIGGWD